MPTASKHADSPMRMADSRSLLASLTGLVSRLQPSLCPARCEGADGGGRGGGGGPGGWGTVWFPGGGIGGSGQPGPACPMPLCGAGGCAPSGKPKAVWADGIGGPGAGGGGIDLCDSKRKRIKLQMPKKSILYFNFSHILVICRETNWTVHSVCSTRLCCGIGYSLVVDINALVFMLHRWWGMRVPRNVRLGRVTSSMGRHWRDGVI